MYLTGLGVGPKALAVLTLLVTACSPTVPSAAPTSSVPGDSGAASVDPAQPLRALGLSSFDGVTVTLTHTTVRAPFSGSTAVRLAPFVDFFVENQSSTTVWASSTATILHDVGGTWEIAGCVLGAKPPQPPQFKGCDFQLGGDELLPHQRCCGSGIPLAWPDFMDPGHLAAPPGHYAVVIPVWADLNDIDAAPRAGSVALFDILP